jgi:hypothetical protein
VVDPPEDDVGAGRSAADTRAIGATIQGGRTPRVAVAAPLRLEEISARQPAQFIADQLFSPRGSLDNGGGIARRIHDRGREPYSNISL